jgi:hypothetical protein
VATVPTFAIGGKIKAADMNFLLGGGANRRPSLLLHVNSPVSIPNAANTTVKWDTVDEDTDAGYSAATGIYTIQTAGLWLFSAYLTWAANGTGERTGSINQAGSLNVTIGDSTLLAASDPGNAGRATVQGITRCAVNDTIQLPVFQSSGGALNFGTAFSGSGGRLRGVYLGA